MLDQTKHTAPSKATLLISLGILEQKGCEGDTNLSKSFTGKPSDYLKGDATAPENTLRMPHKGCWGCDSAWVVAHGRVENQ